MFFIYQQQRKLELVTVDHVPKPSKNDTKSFIRVIVVLARAHPGESVTSFVCQGFLEFLLGSHPIATILRENFVFKIVPMLNPDGVFLGNNRCNLIGQDMNRSWNIATEFSHPTIMATKKMLRELDSSEVREKCGRAFASDSFNKFILLFVELSTGFCFGFACTYHIHWFIHLWKHI